MSATFRVRKDDPLTRKGREMKPAGPRHERNRDLEPRGREVTRPRASHPAESLINEFRHSSPTLPSDFYTMLHN